MKTKMTNLVWGSSDLERGRLASVGVGLGFIFSGAKGWGWIYGWGGNGCRVWKELVAGREWKVEVIYVEAGVWLSLCEPLSFSVFVCLCHSLSQSMNSQQGRGLVGKAMNSRRSRHGCLDKIFGSEMRAFSLLFGWRKFMDGG
ncbi:hypothetical protein Pyn_22205 [Prunus yedoensis var. nudiflora]|uniref:Uncharacterized protein n=1 Tax=Prunus yedoensis var. nudiflora TaxID=2094558 RepID=A0A314ZV92_PRUYE|nr:hypothetical protein Pyn_22205 [Prunus yedoensis var. nudiflora]